MHKITEGPADKSYGIHVAKIAGLPQPLLERADLILQKLENKPLPAKKLLMNKNNLVYLILPKILQKLLKR